MKIFLLFVFVFVFSGTIANAQNPTDWISPQRQSTVYYVAKQANKTSIWIDDIEFTNDKTIVTLHSRTGGGINIMPSAKLICHLKGGGSKVLVLTDATIKIGGGDEYSQMADGDIFSVYFTALSVLDVMKIKRLDFIENEGGKASNTFNIKNIKISKARLVVK